jgi:hypothetical protein
MKRSPGFTCIAVVYNSKAKKITGRTEKFLRSRNRAQAGGSKRQTAVPEDCDSLLPRPSLPTCACRGAGHWVQQVPEHWPSHSGACTPDSSARSPCSDRSCLSCLSVPSRTATHALVPEAWVAGPFPAGSSSGCACRQYRPPLRAGQPAYQPGAVYELHPQEPGSDLFLTGIVVSAVFLRRL